MASWQLIWRLLCYAPRLYSLDTLLWVLIAVLPVLPGLTIREFFNQLTATTSTYPWQWLLLFIVIGVARMTAIYLGRLTKTQHRFTMSALLQHNLLTHILQRPGASALTLGSAANLPAEIPAETPNLGLSTGEVVNIIRDDVSQLEDNIVGTNELLGEGIFALISLVVLWQVNASMTLLVFLPLAVIALVLHRVSERLKRYRRSSRQATQQVTGLMGEIFNAAQAIQVAGAEASVLAEFKQRCQRRSQTMVQDQLFDISLSAGFELLVGLGMGAILGLASQSFAVNQSPLRVGDFALFNYYLAYIAFFFSVLGGFLALSQRSEVAFERMEGLIQTPAVALVAHHPLYLPPVTGKRVPPLPVPAPNWVAPPLASLQVNGLTYHYPGSQRGITEVSFTLERGSLTVITGPVGAGKTTLLQTLLGLLPADAGQIHWNSVPIQQPAQFFGPPQSAYTPQIPQLLAASLRENILLGLFKSDEQVLRAVDWAGLSRDLQTMPQGLDTPIGARGMRLSGGQILRVAAARMLIRQPELLVIDDLSSALDITTEVALWQQLLQLNHSAHIPAWQPTFLVVSHRPGLLKRADQVIILEQGRQQPR
jgi:ATP-binding cassette, subfamily B, bacterial